MTNIEELKSTGLKVTVPRLKVLDLFQHSPERHLTAEDVYRKLLEGPGVRVFDARATIDRSLIWRNSYVGERAELRGAIVCKQCNIKGRSLLFEGVVVGDTEYPVDCVVFGLDDEDELTLKEIGDKYNLSRERIRQLQEQAIGKIRKQMREF